MDECPDGVFSSSPHRSRTRTRRGGHRRHVGAGDEPLSTIDDTLLVLDNFEHPGARGACLTPVARTENLRVLDEPHTAANPAETRPLWAAPRPDAVQLFVERALAADPAVRGRCLGPAICERLDRLPLGSSSPLRAQRSRRRRWSSGSTAAACPRGGARDLPERQRALRRGRVEPSCSRAQHADCFERLAVFRGGWTTDRGARARGRRRSARGVVESSLVQRVDERYEMLETISELAEERSMPAEMQTRPPRHASTCAGSRRKPVPMPAVPTRRSLARTETESTTSAPRSTGAPDRARSLGPPSRVRLSWSWYRGRGTARDDRTEPLLELEGKTPAERTRPRTCLAGRLASELGDAATPVCSSRRRCRSPDAHATARARPGAARPRNTQRHSRATETRRRAAGGELRAVPGARAARPHRRTVSYFAELAYEDGDLESMRSYYERSIEEYAEPHESGVPGRPGGSRRLRAERSRTSRRAPQARAEEARPRPGYTLAGIAASPRETVDRACTNGASRRSSRGWTRRSC